MAPVAPTVDDLPIDDYLMIQMGNVFPEWINDMWRVTLPHRDPNEFNKRVRGIPTGDFRGAYIEDPHVDKSIGERWLSVMGEGAKDVVSFAADTVKRMLRGGAEALGINPDLIVPIIVGIVLIWVLGGARGLMYVSKWDWKVLAGIAIALYLLFGGRR